MSKISNDKLVKNIEKEKKTVRFMIIKYCEGHKHLDPPCDDCMELIKYTEDRIENCRFKDTKTFCSYCEVNCYSPEMREKIKEIMRYSGPRMIFSHPIIAVDHLYQGVKHRLNSNKQIK